MKKSISTEPIINDESSHAGSSGSDGNSSTGSSSSNTDSIQGSDANDSSKNIDKIRDKISKEETQRVLKLRLYVLSILILVTISISVTVFFVTHRAETENFESYYDAAAQKVLDSFDDIVYKLSAINAVGVAATIQALDQPEGKWPFISTSSFHQRSGSARWISDTQMVQILPVVYEIERDVWERYAVGKAKMWIKTGLEYQELRGLNNFEYNPPPVEKVLMINYTDKPIFYYDEQGEEIVDPGPGPYLPMWETSPVLKKKSVNENIFRLDLNQHAQKSVSKGTAIIGGVEYSELGSFNHSNQTTAFFSTLLSIREAKEIPYQGDPWATLFLPVFDSFEENRIVVALLKVVINWRNYFEKILPDNVKGVVVVLKSCDGYFTYEINGPLADLRGVGDNHEPKFNEYVRKETLGVKKESLEENAIILNQDSCSYSIEVYPSQTFCDDHVTTTPLVVTWAVAVVSFFTIVIFFVYNHLVEARQEKVLSHAAASTAIVSSLFPKNVQERLMKQQEAQSRTQKLISFVEGNDNTHSSASDEEHIADLFPCCTVFFADIAGFTAWSSTREPSQVFVLLQTLYECFDQQANKLKVFKVETIGDCYMAATGLPEPQPQHAVIMARFACQCIKRMRQLTRDLEIRLGPDTADLALRVGLHSGPVTAGVLKGDRKRFQLFGDTVNTASRMESNGIPGKIHVSQATADVLVKEGKSHWVEPREELVHAKGKGSMKTYWLNPASSKGNSTTSSAASSECDSLENNSPEECKYLKQERLVDWMVELLMERIRQMVAARTVKTDDVVVSYRTSEGTICLDEIKDIIPMSEFTCPSQNEGHSDNKYQIGEEIEEDLRMYVSMIAVMYHDNPFHNFEHACHVTMSVSNFLRRITTKEINEDDLQSSCYTVGLCSDHLVAFAIVFSALIHDVDHRGCSNLQLIKEEPELSARYREKSIAEQNSLDIAWNALMAENFDGLRSAIFTNQDELLRFRQIVVNCVLATDIFDKELSDWRNARWIKAFSNEEVTTVEQLDRKATIVIEHIIQASDLSHAMQHWNIYRKWNTHLFNELFQAYKDGRMGVNPSTFWYKGELEFFDNYIIPLAWKLKDCHLFGTSSDELLHYAVSNRAEWENIGEELVEELIQGFVQDDEQ